MAVGNVVGTGTFYILGYFLVNIFERLHLNKKMLAECPPAMGEEKPEEELMGKTDYVPIMVPPSQRYTYGLRYFSPSLVSLSLQRDLVSRLGRIGPRRARIITDSLVREQW